MIGNREKALLHIYKAAAQLPEQDYRAIIKEASGLTSSAARSFSHHDFRRSMAAIEDALWCRVDDGHIPPPSSSRISQRGYWQAQLDRFKPPAAAAITINQRYRITTRWKIIQTWAPPDDPEQYLAGIVHQATGIRTTDLSKLSKQQANKLIDALQSIASRTLAAPNKE